MWLIVGQISINAGWRHAPSHSRILAEAINIASTSVQQKRSISLASFLQYPHSRSSRPELFFKKSCLRPATFLEKRLWHRCFPVNFAKFLKTPFFTEHVQWLLLAFAPIEISYSNTVYNTSAAESWICLASFYDLSVSQTSSFEVVTRSFKIQWYLRELDLAINWPGDKFVKPEKLKFWKGQFFPIISFK